MSELFFKCPHCGQEIEAPDDLAGTMINCPACDRMLRVPGEVAPGADAEMIFDCPTCGHGIDTPVGAAGLHLDCPKCGAKIQIPAPKPAPAAPPPTPFNGSPMADEGLEHEKKGATSRIDLPEGDSAPRPQTRMITIKRAGGMQTGEVPRKIASAAPPSADKSKKSGLFGLFGRRS